MQYKPLNFKLSKVFLLKFFTISVCFCDLFLKKHAVAQTGKYFMLRCSSSLLLVIIGHVLQDRLPDADVRGQSFVNGQL